MTIIDQLEHTVTPAVLGKNDSVAHMSLLEQFYAILVTCLAEPQVYTQLLRSNINHADMQSPSALDSSTVGSTFFEQLWQQPHQRQRLITELATTHHIDEDTTIHLVTNAAHLAYKEIKQLAKGQFLPAFLQAQRPEIRHYLPAWVSVVIPSASTSIPTEPSVSSRNNAPQVTIDSSANLSANNPSRLTQDAIQSPTAAIFTSTPVVAETNPVPAGLTDNLTAAAIHANPSAHRASESAQSPRYQRSHLLIGILILSSVLLATALVWVLFFRTDSAPVPTVVAPVITAPAAVLPEPVMKPVELVVGVDDSGNLYHCTATVGDASLQALFAQALTVSFGEQVSICNLTVTEGVATTVANIGIDILPDMLTLLRATPFARLQLQNDAIRLSAPDVTLLQRLVTDIRALVPSMMVAAAEPIPLPDDNNASITDAEADNSEAMSGRDYEFLDNNDNGDNTQNYQPSDENSDNTLIPPPSRDIDQNSSMNNSSMNDNTRTAPSGPISLSELDEMVNSSIVSEPAQGGRPVREAE